jgi:hypothetical protein
MRTGEEKSGAQLWGHVSTDACPYRISLSFRTLLYFRLASRIREAMDNVLLRFPSRHINGEIVDGILFVGGEVIL